MLDRPRPLLIMLALALILPALAFGADIYKKVELKDGTSITGKVIREADTAIILELGGGTIVEVAWKNIQSMTEVAPGDQGPPPDPRDDKHDEADRRDHDDDRAADLADLRTGRRVSSAGKGLGLGLGIPTFVTGAAFVGFASPGGIVIEGGAGTGFFVARGLGFGLLATSLGAAIAGDLVARGGLELAGGDFHWRSGIAITGSVLAGSGVGMLAIVLSWPEFDVDDDATPVLVGVGVSGLSMLITGFMLLFGDTDEIDDEVDDMAEDEGLSLRSGHPTLRFAGAWAAPLPDGGAAGFSLIW